MLHIINDVKLINQLTESHYRFHTQIDSSLYPQVHDFYEIAFVTEGELVLQLCSHVFHLHSGHMVLIRPGDIHSKSGENCAHINLAFPASSIDALFQYLCDKQGKNQLLSLPFVPPIQLNHPEFLSYQKKLQQLNIIPTDQPERVRIALRSILFDLITHYFLPAQPQYSPVKVVPKWLASALSVWQTNEHRNEGLDFFCNFTNYNKEHICRTFKQYFNMTATEYLNQQRLNYAVNLLIHSDYSITDIAYESGFGSLSRFYHVFHSAYGLSPKKFFEQYSPSL